jgi:hypothetical protein
MAPGFTWNKKDIYVYQNPPVMRGADCPDVNPYPPIYGGPWGSAVSWQDPDGSGPLEIPTNEAYIWVQVEDQGGNVYTAEPKVYDALVRLAERTGLRDGSGNYVRGVRHIRISHMS